MLPCIPTLTVYFVESFKKVADILGDVHRVEGSPGCWRTWEKFGAGNQRASDVFHGEIAQDEGLLMGTLAFFNSIAIRVGVRADSGKV